MIRVYPVMNQNVFLLTTNREVPRSVVKLVCGERLRAIHEAKCPRFRVVPHFERGTHILYITLKVTRTKFWPLPQICNDLADVLCLHQESKKKFRVSQGFHWFPSFRKPGTEKTSKETINLLLLVSRSAGSSRNVDMVSKFPKKA